jgi:hypothetical protein
MCGDGRNTGGMWGWAVSTRVDTSHSLSKAMSILGSWPDMSSEMPCGPISPYERRNGDGRVCGDDATAGRTSSHGWRTGQSIDPRIGSRGSIKRTTKRSWSRYDKASNGAVLLANRNGKSRSPSVWAWIRLIGAPAARGKGAKAKSSLKGERTRRSTRITSAYQYRTCPAFVVPASGSPLPGRASRAQPWDQLVPNSSTPRASVS